jgi:hypothetical protein
MSIALMGTLTAKREDAEQDKSKDEKAPAVKPYVDAFAALVPAEVLALNALVLERATKVSKDKKITEITEPTALKVAFGALLVLSVAIFVSSRLLAKNRQNKAPQLWVLIVQCLIPPLAFVGWTMLQPVSAFDVLDTGLSVGERQIAALIGGVFLGIAAGMLGYKLDAEPPTPKEPPPAELKPDLSETAG